MPKFHTSVGAIARVHSEHHVPPFDSSTSPGVAGQLFDTEKVEPILDDVSMFGTAANWVAVQKDDYPKQVDKSYWYRRGQDVLSGTGGFFNKENAHFRRLVQQSHQAYKARSSKEKRSIAMSLVTRVYAGNGCFLDKSGSILADDKALLKCMKALKDRNKRTEGRRRVEEGPTHPPLGNENTKVAATICAATEDEMAPTVTSTERAGMVETVSFVNIPKGTATLLHEKRLAGENAASFSLAMAHEGLFDANGNSPLMFSVSEDDWTTGTGV